MILFGGGVLEAAIDSSARSIHAVSTGDRMVPLVPGPLKMHTENGLVRPNGYVCYEGFDEAAADVPLAFALRIISGPQTTNLNTLVVRV